jgi:hypothetical protein
VVEAYRKDAAPDPGSDRALTAVARQGRGFLLARHSAWQGGGGVISDVVTTGGAEAMDLRKEVSGALARSVLTQPAPPHRR